MNRDSRLVGLALSAGVAGVLMVGVAVSAPALGAAPPAEPFPKRTYTNKATLRLPLRIEDSALASVQEVRLYVKKRTGDWVCAAIAPSTQTHFIYSAPQDGEYWFSVVTVDRSGRPTPADVSKEPPSLIVVVDTQAPDVEVRPLPAANGDVCLKCEIRDANPDPASCKLEYRATDQSWRPLEQLPDTPGYFRVSEVDVLTGRVRATVCDLAKNTTTKEINMAPSPTTAIAPPPPPQVFAPEGHSQKPATETSAAYAYVPSAVMPPPVQHTSAMPTRTVVNSTHASLEYQIDQAGPSGIGKVEVWLTKNQGQTWQCLGEDPDRKSPVEFDLPGEGTYGISLAVSNGTGFGGGSPAKGDVPDCWIEVDMTKPVARLNGVQAAPNAAALMISWTADDKNLGTEPIDLYYAAHREGPWLPIARGVPNSGLYHWSVPRDVTGRFYVRMDVTDQAGNVCRCETPEPVVMDTSRPKARVLAIASGTPRSTVPTGN